MKKAFTRAIVRRPGPNYIHGITASLFGSPDLKKALGQHEAYCKALQESGLQLTILDPDPNFPDAPFVEDTAVIIPECAIIARPGDPRRRGEELTILSVLKQYKTIETIKGEGTLDGGDVLLIDKQFYVGLSERTNEAGSNQLKEIVKPHGYQTKLIKIKDILHLKSGVNHLGGHWISIYKSWDHLEEFKEFNKILVNPEESYAANCLFINSTILIPKGFPDTLSKIKAIGHDFLELDMSEYQKMDGGLTCLSLRF